MTCRRGRPSRTRHQFGASRFVAIVALIASFGVLFAFCHAQTKQAARPVLQREALHSALAPHAVLLAVARAGARVVAVGERGIVVYSDDDGRTWRQALVPVSVTLTSIFFVNRASGWAVGHSGVILHSSDAGASWRLQLDGQRVAQLTLTDASKAAAGKADVSYRRFARQLVADGPDKPFLAVLFLDERHGFAFGAGGIAVETTDAGRQWFSVAKRVNDLQGLHIYGAASTNRGMVLAGEQGFAQRSSDGGLTFRHVPALKKITYFSAAIAPNGWAVVGGLRGAIYSARSIGSSFTPISAPNDASVSGISATARGGMLLATQSGSVWLLRSGSTQIRRIDTPELPSLSGIVETQDGGLVAVGFGGAVRISPPLRVARLAQTR